MPIRNLSPEENARLANEEAVARNARHIAYAQNINDLLWLLEGFAPKCQEQANAHARLLSAALRSVPEPSLAGVKDPYPKGIPNLSEIDILKSRAEHFNG